MAAPKVNANGHRRRQVVRTVKAEETHCALCDQPVDPNLKWPDLRCGVVDEDVPRSRGGSQYERSNCCLMHNECNRWKSTMTLAEARAKLKGISQSPAIPVVSSPIW
jgi:hypothetical protein